MLVMHNASNIYCTTLFSYHSIVHIFFSSTSYGGFYYSLKSFDNATSDSDTSFSTNQKSSSLSDFLSFIYEEEQFTLKKLS